MPCTRPCYSCYKSRQVNRALLRPLFVFSKLKKIKTDKTDRETDNQKDQERLTNKKTKRDAGVMVSSFSAAEITLLSFQRKLNLSPATNEPVPVSIAISTYLSWSLILSPSLSLSLSLSLSVSHIVNPIIRDQGSYTCAIFNDLQKFNRMTALGLVLKLKSHDSKYRENVRLRCTHIHKCL